MADTIFRGYSESDALRSDRSAGDRTRHREKIREAIRENIADVIAEEAIIGRSGDRIVKVPIRGIREYRFVFGDNEGGVGTGDGDTEEGQVVGKVGEGRRGPGEGPAGDQPGTDHYETEVSLEELTEIMFEDLELPELERKRLRELPAERERRRKGYRPTGVRVHLDKRRTAKARIRRKTARGGASTDPSASPGGGSRSTHSSDPTGVSSTDSGGSSARGAGSPAGARESSAQTTGSSAQAPRSSAGARESSAEATGSSAGASESSSDRPGRFPFHRDDLTYRRLVRDEVPQSNAVVICIMDTSGSMDTMKKYLARSFFFLLYSFVRTKYQNVEVVFVAHHARAREVSEEEFFHRGESGGTLISTGYRKALEVVDERYPPALWNVYAFHCSDGDNWSADNEAAIEAAGRICQISNLFGYGEIKPLNSRRYGSSMLDVFRGLEAPNFQTVKIERKEDLWPGFKQLLSKERVRGAEA